MKTSLAVPTDWFFAGVGPVSDGTYCMLGWP